MALRSRSIIELLITAKDRASQGISKVTAALGGMGRAATAAAGAITAGLGAAVAGAFTFGIRSAADFEKALDRIQAVTRSGADEMKRLEDAANRAGSETKFTATEAAGALETLVRSGKSAEQAIALLPNVLALATAESLELADAAAFVTTTLAQFGEGVDQTQKVVDLLVATAQSANTNVSQVAVALRQAGVVASQAGLSMEQTAAAIGTLADVGLRGEQAGTALRNILVKLSDPASKVRGELFNLGIATGDFQEVIDKLANSSKDTTSAISAFGTEAAPAIKALLENNEKLKEFGESLTDIEGRAAEAAATMSDNLQGAATRLGSAWDSLTRSLAAPFIGPITKAVDAITVVVQKTTGLIDGLVEKWNQLRGVIGASEEELEALAKGNVIDAFVTLGEKIATTRDRIESMNQGLKAQLKVLGENSQAVANNRKNIAAAEAQLEKLYLAYAKVSVSLVDTTEKIDDQGDSTKNQKQELAKLVASIEAHIALLRSEEDAVTRGTIAYEEKTDALKEILADYEKINGEIVESSHNIDRNVTSIRSQIPFWSLLGEEAQNALSAILNATGQAATSSEALADRVQSVADNLTNLGNVVQKLSSARVITPQLQAQIDFYGELADEIRKVERAQDKLNEEFADGTLTLQELERVERLALKGIQKLDAATLQNLRSQVQQIREEFEQFRQEAEKTRQSLQERLLSIRGEEEALKLLRLQREQLEIQEDLRKARLIDDQVSIKALQESLKLLKEISEEEGVRLRQGGGRPAPLPAPTTGSGASAGAGFGGTPIRPGERDRNVVNINALILDQRDTERLARKLKPTLDQINRLSR